MARYCPEKEGPAVYLDCMECESRLCEQWPDKPFRIIIAGSRDFNDYKLLLRTMCAEAATLPRDRIEIISGGAKGADSLGETFAKRNQLKLTVIPAEWEKYGNAAGPIRNEAMAAYASQANGSLVLFWDGKSKGSKNMLSQAEKYGIKSTVVYF